MADSVPKHSHAISIDQELKIMNTQMKDSPKLLHESAGKESCCIFRVPQSLIEINKEAYRPRIVSIGPYHHGNKDLEMIQEHKWRFLNDMLTRTGKPLKDFLDMMAEMEVRIRQSYSESTGRFSRYDLANMMVLDGVFLIELFRKVGKLVLVNKEDPFFQMAWLSPFLMRDLLRLENQIPFFVLKKLFNESKTGTIPLPEPEPEPSLSYLILKFFNYMVRRKKNVLEEYKNLEGKHLLDFFRKSFIKTQTKEPLSEEEDPSLKLINPATKLHVAGVKFRPNLIANSFLDIEFRRGTLLIPQINMDDFYSSFLTNCVVFEQCYSHCSNHITTYVVFMGRLINTSTDADLLSDSKIIENYYGTDKEISKFFNNIGKDVAFDIKKSYLSGLFTDVNNYCKNGWHVGWAGFKNTYFVSPWAAISAFAAFLLLSLAVLQTFYTVYSYYKKP